ncbi:MAG: dethiobiotin synthase [Acidiphilium sp.]
MSAYFVTAAGTEIGKTHIAAGLIRHWRGAGVQARAIKPVASGYQSAMSTSSDAGILLGAMGEPATDAAVARICPWRFPDPISPDMAAARAGRSIPFDALLSFCRAEMARGPLLIEGVGGVMVPLDDTHTVRDWIAALGIPALLVAGGYLGAISHTLCAVEALRARDIAIAAIVLNQIEPLPVPIERTRAAILRHLSAPLPVLVAGEAEWQDWAVQAHL